MIALDAKPQLADKAKLRLDRKTNQYVLLYPEKGLVLNRTGTSIVQLCTGENTVSDIVDRLHGEHQEAERPVVEKEVLAFLETLLGRSLLRLEP
ncbi:MAG TPA: pyrroloquinoline quinone biosynthesis peptide chaperone PqqD [Polyangiaceae bacterium]|jgi:pyrroloquinoline quinone biosynthesis protein D